MIEEITDYANELGASGVEVKNAVTYMNTSDQDWFGEIPLELSESQREQPIQLIVYYEKDDFQAEWCGWLEQRLLGEYVLEVEKMQEENWQQNWMDYYEIKHLTDRLVAVPKWLNYECQPGEHVIILNPGMSFGTGHHATTETITQAIQSVLQPGDKVIDVGCGTGILSFASAALGASEVLGLDLDEMAVKSAQENMAYQTDTAICDLVQSNRLNFKQNDLLVDIDQPADLIVANILPHILVRMFEDATRLLSEGGYLILGGILQDKLPSIQEDLTTYPFEWVASYPLNDWVSIVYRRISR